jgi:hypothetical protein
VVKGKMKRQSVMSVKRKKRREERWLERLKGMPSAESAR